MHRQQSAMTNELSPMSYQLSHKPRVMIVIATDIIGGPGKGLFQFLKFADHNRFDYLLCNYDRAGMSGFREDFLAKAEADGIPVHSFYQRAVIDPLVVLEARKTLRQHRVDIIQTHGYKSNILGYALKLSSGIPWIAFAHGYTAENRKIAFYNRLDQLCYRFSDLAVVVSEPLKQLLLARSVRPEKIVKLPNAVDRQELASQVDRNAFKQSLSLRADSKVLAVIGRMSPEKGQLVFLKAFREAKAQIPGLQALLIGDGQEKPRLIKYCRDHDLAKDVIFTGHVTNVGDYYRIIDMLVIPSYSEGLPNVLLEAMALGVPVVSTRVGGVAEVLQGMDANVVSAGDNRALAERMLFFLNDPASAKESARRGGRIIARRYDPAARAQKLVSLYHRVLRSHPATHQPGKPYQHLSCEP
jgi:glycosyltransferase involved in cell wall biosynthesis